MLSPKFGHAVTPASLNGAPATLVLDTGAQFTTIAKSTADRLDLNTIPTNGVMHGLGGYRSIYLFYAKFFQIGRLHGKNLPLVVSDFTLSRDGSLDGLLGADFLTEYNLDLDFADHRARLFKVLEGCTAPSAPLDDPLFVAPLMGSVNEMDHRPFVKVEIEGHTFRAVVDSGAQFTLMFAGAARRLGLSVEGLAAEPHFHAGGVGPKIRTVVRHVISPITIGDITVSNLPIAIADESSGDNTDILLGLDFLTRVHVFLAFSSNTLIMQYPPKPSPAIGK